MSSTGTARIEAQGSGFSCDSIRGLAQRTHVLRSGPDGVAWELWLRGPLPEHVGLVAGLWAGDADSAESRHRLIADGELWLMFNLGPPQRVVEMDGSTTGVGAVYR